MSCGVSIRCQRRKREGLGKGIGARGRVNRTAHLGTVHPENFKDEYRIRVLAMLDEKSKGKEIVIDKAAAPKHGRVIDIMEALKRSMARVPAKNKPTIRAARNIKNVY
jgi:non-homologous end joining protein Ku